MITDLDQFKASRVRTEACDLGGATVEVHGLTTGGFSALMRARAENPEDTALHALVIVKHGVPIFSDKSIEEIGAAVPMPDASKMAEKVMELSGLDEEPEKN